MKLRMHLKILERAQKEIRKLTVKDPKLAAEVITRIQQLGNREFEKLEIRPIIRKNGKYKIQEIKIFHPSSFRIFYVEIFENDDCTYIIDCKKKKVNKFDNSYFKTLDRCLERELKNGEGENIK